MYIKKKNFVYLKVNSAQGYVGNYAAIKDNTRSCLRRDKLVKSIQASSHD